MQKINGAPVIVAKKTYGKSFLFFTRKKVMISRDKITAALNKIKDII